jgi:D-alanyl-D-alanine carboxypeptidase/D-alanyl-D-alanine-endopeptidase (penicillin-binding protein 4)
MRVVCLHRLLLPVLLAGLACGASAAKPAPPFPADISAALRASGLPLKSFGFDARRVDGDATSALATLNADQPFTLASTAKLVTSLAALDLLGAAHRWETEAYATGPVSNGRLRGNLVIVGGQAGLTPTELARWF